MHGKELFGQAGRGAFAFSKEQLRLTPYLSSLWLGLVTPLYARVGRKLVESLRVGDALDFWRVEFYEPPNRLRLCAEMKLPGRAWLEFEVTGNEQQSTVRQTAIFDPVGLSGLLYWYGIYPLHQLVFAGMLRNIVRAAQYADDTATRKK